MSDAAADAPVDSGKSRKLPLVLSLILAVAGAVGGYFAVSSGVFPIAKTGESHDPPSEKPMALADTDFVEIDPIMISLSGNDHVRHLRFRSQLEVEAAYADDVQHILPRIVDVMNGYLRALDIGDFEDPVALTRLRAQILRRVQVVAGKGRVRDLLVMEFVLN